MEILILWIFLLTKDETKELIYEEEEEIMQLNLGQCIMIHESIAFNIKQIQSGAPLKIIDWLSITRDQFDKFRIIYRIFYKKIPQILNILQRYFLK